MFLYTYKTCIVYKSLKIRAEIRAEFHIKKIQHEIENNKLHTKISFKIMYSSEKYPNSTKKKNPIIEKIGASILLYTKNKSVY